MATPIREPSTAGMTVESFGDEWFGVEVVVCCEPDEEVCETGGILLGDGLDGEGCEAVADVLDLGLVGVCELVDTSDLPELDDEDNEVVVDSSWVSGNCHS